MGTDDGQAQIGDGRDDGPPQERAETYASFRQRFGRPVLGLLVTLAALIFVEVFDPYGVSSTSDKLSREAFNAILAPWYDFNSGSNGPSNTGPDAGRTPQDAALVVLLDDGGLERAQTGWPLPSQRLADSLVTLAERYNPAAVFVDVLLTHERGVRPPAGGSCYMLDPDPGRAGLKQALQNAAIDDSGTRSDAVAEFAAVSDPDSVFWCLKYHYRPVEQPLPSAAFGLETSDEVASDPRVPLIMAIGNPEIARGATARLVRAANPGDYLGPVKNPTAPTSEAGWRALPLIPGLRGVATAAVVQGEVDPAEPGTIPLRIRARTPRPDARATREVDFTTPAAAALVAYCQRNPESGFKGCRDLDGQPRDTLFRDNDRWRLSERVFLRWGLTPAITASYLLAAETGRTQADPGAQDCEPGTEACQCNYKRAKAMTDRPSGFAGALLERLKWTVDITGADLWIRDRGEDTGTARARCPYTPTMPADLTYWPFRETQLMQRAGAAGDPVTVDKLIDGRVVFIGTNFDIHQDRVASPVHDTVPGVFMHAMAFDNLLRHGADWRRPAGAPAWAFGLSWLDLLEIGSLATLVLVGLLLRELLHPKEQLCCGHTTDNERLAAWEPVLVIGLLPFLVIILVSVTSWPIADWLLIAGALALHYKVRLISAIQEVAWDAWCVLRAAPAKSALALGLTLVCAVAIWLTMPTYAVTIVVLVLIVGLYFGLIAWAVRRFARAVGARLGAA